MDHITVVIGSLSIATVVVLTGLTLLICKSKSSNPDFNSSSNSVNGSIESKSIEEQFEDHACLLNEE